MTFQIDAGDRIGLVGRNGSGKTTLLRILAGLLEPDRGRVRRARSLRLGYLSQTPDLDPDATVLAATMTAFDHLRGVEAGMRELEEKIAAAPDGSPEQARLLDQHDRLHVAFEKAGGWNLEGRAEAALMGLGLGRDHLSRRFGALSGGEKSRVALARLLLAEPDVLLLDEPTNHLDIEGVEWLEGWLARSAVAFLVVSHDRYFLDRTTTSTLFLRGARISRYPAPYSRFLELRAEETLAEERALEKQRQFIEKEEEFIRRFMAGQRSRQARGRLRRLDRMERIGADPGEGRSMGLRLDPQRRMGDFALRASDLAMGFQDRTLFQGLSLEVAPGDRVGILGRNGTGKTTLLRVLAGILAPRRGRVTLPPGASIGFYDQEQRDLPEGGTPFSAIHDIAPRLTELEVRSWLGRFLFSGDDVLRPLALLSGGERSRVALARLLLRQPNVLLLDEPTNHLDIPARQALEAALLDFPGAVIAVTHDRYLLDQIATRILVLDAGLATVHEGNYTDLRLRRERDAEEVRAAAARSESAPRRTARGAAGSTGTHEAPRIPLKELERRIIALEEERGTLVEDVGREEVFRDGARMKRIHDRLAEIDRDLDILNADWFGRA